MDDKFLFKVAIATSLLGLAALSLILLLTDYEDVSPGGLTSTTVHDVAITGKVVAVEKTGGVFVVQIAEEKVAKIIVFDENLINFKAGDNVTVRGEVQNYRGTREVIAERISVNLHRSSSKA